MKTIDKWFGRRLKVVRNYQHVEWLDVLDKTRIQDYAFEVLKEQIVRHPDSECIQVKYGFSGSIESRSTE